MPVTPAHAAAVIPLRRWKPYFWLSPLVVGSMAPDFPYYAFVPEPLHHLGHTSWGMVAICVPAGLAVLYAYHQFFKWPLVLLAPGPLRARLWRHCGPFPFLPLRRLAWISVLIYLGAATHVAWDGLTHEGGWALRDDRPLSEVMVTVAGQPLHGVGLLQYGSSALGLGLIAWWSWQWYRRAPADCLPGDTAFMRRARAAIVGAMFAFAALTGVLCGLRYATSLVGPFRLMEFLRAGFIIGADAFLLALLLFAAAVHWLRGPWVGCLSRTSVRL